jgi:putative transposase
VRFWWNRFGTIFAAEIRRSRVQAMRHFRHRRWHLDAVFVKINGVKHYLWRAVDHEAEVLESFVTEAPGQDGGTEVPQEIASAAWLYRDNRDRSPGVLWCCAQGSGCHRQTGDRPMVEQPGRVLPSTVSTTRTRHAPLPADAKPKVREATLAEICRRPWPGPQPIRFAALRVNQERHLSSRPMFKERRTAALAAWRQLCAA